MAREADKHGRARRAGKLTVTDVDIAGKTALVRVDFNVPFRPGTTEISDDIRIKASLPTLQYLQKRQCRVVICSHLGRPKGSVVEDLRMAPASARLSDLLGVSVAQAPACVGPDVESLVNGLTPGGVGMLENLRFHPGEEDNDPEFAESLAGLADVYVNDAFAAAHRAHASTARVARYLPAVSGLLMARELEALGKVLDSPERPLVAILGGAKVSDKMGALQQLASRADTVLVGGGMAATFLKAKGLGVGRSPVEEEWVEAALEIMRGVEQRGRTMLLPEDLVVADEFSSTARHQDVGADEVPPSWRIMDIGTRTAELFEAALKSVATVVWNGPMGVFEWEPFAHGTKRIAGAVASLQEATTVIGGGSTAEAVTALGLEGNMSHVSTGGGATLEFLAGKVLPGVAALLDRDSARGMEGLAGRAIGTSRGL